MTPRFVAIRLAQYAAITVGQAVISYAIQQGIARAQYAAEMRRRRKRVAGFR